jgi:two-component system, chemotaxis family, CheB/CheR fusion protein
MFLAQFGPGALVVSQDLRILEVRGNANRFLIHPGDVINLELFAAIRREIAPPLGAAIKDAMDRQTTVRTEPLEIREETAITTIRATVIPIRPAERQFLIIVFEDAVYSSGELPVKDPAQTPRSQAVDPQRHIMHLEQDLAATRQYLQAIIEELRSANEEAQSTNEELQSTNEELQTAKEEMQSSNEELSTLNSEMQSRNLELAQVNDDLKNLLSSMNMPVIIVGHDLRLRRFTPAAETVLHVIPTDVGRPISDLQPRISVANLEKILRQVLDSLMPYEAEVQDEKGNAYVLRVSPYRAYGNRIEGAVLQLLDVGELKRTLEDARHARDYAQGIVDTVREPLVVFDDSLIARDANRSFYQYFRTGRSEIIGRNITEILPWDLGKKLEELLGVLVKTGTAVQDQELDQYVEGKGPRTLVINALRMPMGGVTQVLVAFEDVTERKQAVEARYRRLFESARDGILIVDAADETIADINPFSNNCSDTTGHNSSAANSVRRVR